MSGRKPRVLFADEAWFTHRIHVKGFGRVEAYGRLWLDLAGWPAKADQPEVRA